jgi:hypothetical protein
MRRSTAADQPVIATTGAMLHSLADAVRDWAQTAELDVFRPGLAEGAAEWSAKLAALADNLDEGGTIAALDLLHELAIVHGCFGNELRAAVRAAARGGE